MHMHREHSEKEEKPKKQKLVLRLINNKIMFKCVYIGHENYRYQFSNVRITFHILALDAYSLANAKFSIVVDGTTHIMTTDENGLSNSVLLPDNSEKHDGYWETNEKGEKLRYIEPWVDPITTTYYVKEEEAPKGHKKNEAIVPITVTMPGEYGQNKEAPFTDTPIFCKNKFKFEKLDAKGNPVEGAVYKVEYFDASGPEESKLKKTWYLETDENGIIYMDDAHVTARLGYTSDSFYHYDGQIVIPIDGYLQLTEVASPAEFVINEDVYGIPTGEDADLYKQVYDDLEHCKVNLVKYAEDGSSIISGVEFELKFLEADLPETSRKSPYFKRLLQEGESVVYTSNENGELSFDDLDQGTYQITEIKTYPGQTLLKEPIVFHLPMQMTEQEATEYGNVNFDSARLDDSYTNKWYFYECTYEITDTPNFTVPATGGGGVWKYAVGGMVILGAIGAGFVWETSMNRKRRRRNKTRRITTRK